LDPFKPIDLNQETMNIQVVALDWKWLFIYPNQQIASVNLAEIPVGQPVDFYITSDTVMNSFWIPQLGGQIYAMPGMSTQMHLEADRVGDFNGWSANISGEGFASMTFMAKSVSAGSFANWIQTARKSSSKLTMAAYEQLAEPSFGSPVKYYSLVQGGLYNDVIMNYMTPGGGSAGASQTGGYSSTAANSNMSEMSKP
jgi:cytochrome o ubiquinol oxidase subunit 2